MIEKFTPAKVEYLLENFGQQDKIPHTWTYPRTLYDPHILSFWQSFEDSIICQTNRQTVELYLGRGGGKTLSNTIFSIHIWHISIFKKIILFSLKKKYFKKFCAKQYVTEFYYENAISGL